MAPAGAISAAKIVKTVDMSRSGSECEYTVLRSTGVLPVDSIQGMSSRAFQCLIVGCEGGRFGSGATRAVAGDALAGHGSWSDGSARDHVDPPQSAPLFFDLGTCVHLQYSLRLRCTLPWTGSHCRSVFGNESGVMLASWRGEVSLWCGNSSPKELPASTNTCLRCISHIHPRCDRALWTTLVIPTTIASSYRFPACLRRKQLLL